MEKVIVVDNNDQMLGYKARKSLSDFDIVRVSVLFVKNSIGSVLLSKRSLNKKNNPGQWGPTVAGMNNIGETYLSTVIKEAEQEIGLIIGRTSNIKRIKKIKLQTNHQIFAIFFEVVVDRKEKFLVDKNEVQQVARFSKKKLKKELENTNNIFLKEFFS